MNAPTSPETVSHPDVQLDWIEGVQFSFGRPGGPSLRIDGDGQAAPSPFDVFLGAIASCASTDVVTILQKGRTPVQSLNVRVQATRVNGTPRRLTAAVLHFTIRGAGITRKQAERAVELSVTKYCSVRSSLAADVPITWTIDL